MISYASQGCVILTALCHQSCHTYVILSETSSYQMFFVSMISSSVIVKLKVKLAAVLSHSLIFFYIISLVFIPSLASSHLMRSVSRLFLCLCFCDHILKLRDDIL